MTADKNIWLRFHEVGKRFEDISIEELEKEIKIATDDACELARIAQEYERLLFRKTSNDAAIKGGEHE